MTVALRWLERSRGADDVDDVAVARAVATCWERLDEAVDELTSRYGVDRRQVFEHLSRATAGAMADDRRQNAVGPGLVLPRR